MMNLAPILFALSVAAFFVFGLPLFGVLFGKLFDYLYDQDGNRKPISKLEDPFRDGIRFRFVDGPERFIIDGDFLDAELEALQMRDEWAARSDARWVNNPVEVCVPVYKTWRLGRLKFRRLVGVKWLPIAV